VTTPKGVQVKHIDLPPNQEVESIPNLLVECESKKIMSKKDAMVLEYLIFCVFDQYYGYTFMDI
jgi:hypothetical protein